MEEVKPPEKTPDQMRDDRYTELAFGVLFLLGGLYVVFAFSSFLAFVVGFFGLLFGVSSLAEPVCALVRSRPKSEISRRDSENALLHELQEHPSGLSAVEAALATSLDVRDVDDLLSGLAGLGYLTVESSGGALFYAIPTQNPAITPVSGRPGDVANSTPGTAGGTAREPQNIRPTRPGGKDP